MGVRGLSGSRSVAIGASVAAVTLALAGCNGATSGNSGNHAAANNTQASTPTTTAPPTSQAAIRVNASGVVKVDTPVTVRVAEGTLTHVRVAVHRNNQALPGHFNASKTRWTANRLLEPGTRYVVRARAVDANGVATSSRSHFSSQDLTLDQQTYPGVQPLQGQTVGVGMPVIVRFDIPVKSRAEFQRHMTVTSNPRQAGSWSWISDQEVHWRPVHFWKPGTTVTVDLKLNSLPAGRGIYGQMDRHVRFHVGRAIIMRANLQTDEMNVYINGALARTIPITGGMAPDFETRSGVKLISEKYTHIRMNSATVGIQPGSPDYYNLADVEYAQRVTNSGEFLHAAPWSEYAQGQYNVSHGCVGMSTENAAWLFGITHIGDPVEVSGTNRGIEPGNGWTDWDESWAQWKAGSALN